jgi:energy-coupling factor transporter transmembrane protein EcfT
MKKLNPSKIGFLQAIGVLAYCALAVGILNLFARMFFAPPGFLGSLLILVLLVFSAAITGSIVFGYAAYLAFHKKVKEALVILGFTALYFLAIIIVILVLISAFS